MRKLLVLIGALSSATLSAADFMTAGVDAARTGWVKNEKTFSTSNVKDMKLLWKVKLESTPEMHNLLPPLVLSNVMTASGPKEIAIVAGITDDVWGIDTGTGQQVWHKHFDSTYQPPAPGTGGFGDPLLHAVDRQAVYDVRVVDIALARIGLWERSALLISAPTLALLSAEELRAQVAQKMVTNTSPRNTTAQRRCRTIAVSRRSS